MTAPSLRGLDTESLPRGDGVAGYRRPIGLRDVQGAGCLVGGLDVAEQAQLVQPPEPPHGPGVRPGELGDPHPETAQVASLLDELASTFSAA